MNTKTKMAIVLIALVLITVVVFAFSERTEKPIMFTLPDGNIIEQRDICHLETFYPDFGGGDINYCPTDANFSNEKCYDLPHNGTECLVLYLGKSFNKIIKT